MFIQECTRCIVDVFREQARSYLFRTSVVSGFAAFFEVSATKPTFRLTLRHANELIRRPSVTPVDADCQKLMMQRLGDAGFALEPMRIFDVDNFWATHGKHEGPVLCFAGHTDVVPTGPVQAWQNDPFDALIDENGMLCGRGAADMKGSLAAMLVAAERFVTDYPDHKGSVAFLITSDEEGPAHHGTKAVIERLAARKERLDWCIVGEPSSTSLVGDVVKNGRRGSLGATLTCAVYKATWLTRTWRRTRSTWPHRPWPNSPPNIGMTATPSFRRPASRFPTSTPVPAPPT